KLLPLMIFIAAGIRFAGVAALISLPPISLRQFSTAALLMIFVYGGYDVVPVPAGEALDPRRHVPSALVPAILVVLGVLEPALTGSFAKLAVVSAVARLVTYTGVAAATWRLRSPRFAATVKPATFVAPFGPLVPAVAMIVSIGIAAGATREQLLGGGAALGV